MAPGGKKPGKAAETRKAAGVQSVEIGLKVLVALADARRPLALRELAAAAGMSASKTHRYLVSLVRMGMIEQDARHGSYDLGRKALSIGLAAQYRLDPLALADRAIDGLHTATDLTVSLAVWGDYGATVIRRKEGLRAISVSPRLGAVMPLLTTNIGRLFAAFLPETILRPLVVQEFKLGLVPMINGERVDRAGFDRLLAGIREQGWAAARGDIYSEIDVLAAPVFDHTGVMALSISIMGPRGTVDLSPGSDFFKLLLGTTRELSEQLGHSPARMQDKPADTLAVG